MIKTFTIDDEKWRVVPVEPTDKMVRAMEDQWMRGSSMDMAKREYVGMLSTAPQPEQVESEPVGWWNGKETVFFEHEVDGPVGEVRIPLYTTPQPDRTAELEQLRQRVAELEDERDAALARLSEERDIWDGMLGNAADKIAHLELELDDCLYVLDALWDKQCNKIVTQKWAEILIRNKRDIGALSADDSCQQSTE